MAASGSEAAGRGRWLDRVERLGNRLPHPATLFAAGTLAVFLLSAAGAALGWAVQEPSLAGGEAGERIRVLNLLSADGIWWLLSTAVSNFVGFPPLGIVLVGMLGIGVAERSGLVDALVRTVLGGVSGRWLTPATVFIGIMSSLGLDAGYVVLPPLAASLYAAFGRSPLAGIAAAFAGVSAGFSANLLLTAVDPMLAGFTEAGARFVDPGYRVAATANWWFMIVSTALLTGCGWLVTARFVEPRLARPAGGRADRGGSGAGTPAADRRALRLSLQALALCLALYALAVLVPGAPLHGAGERFPRWVEAIVPAMALGFFVPGLTYGIASGRIRSDRDVADMLGQTMAAMGPYIVLAFFAAQFIEAFRHSQLGELAAVAGGNWLATLAIPGPLLAITFVALVMAGNLLVGSASAKYAFFAPVFVPMFMQVGLSPELTQAAYRVGDSITNVITPFNPYMVIVLAQLQRHAAGSGLGTLIALMLPYALAFAAVWIPLLVAWMLLGLPLGPGGTLSYP